MAVHLQWTSLLAATITVSRIAGSGNSSGIASSISLSPTYLATVERLLTADLTDSNTWSETPGKLICKAELLNFIHTKKLRYYDNNN